MCTWVCVCVYMCVCVCVHVYVCVCVCVGVRVWFWFVPLVRREWVYMGVWLGEERTGWMRERESG